MYDRPLCTICIIPKGPCHIYIYIFTHIHKHLLYLVCRFELSISQYGAEFYDDVIHQFGDLNAVSMGQRDGTVIGCSGSFLGIELLWLMGFFSSQNGIPFGQDISRYHTCGIADYDMLDTF